jgi:hypothetical protein
VIWPDGAQTRLTDGQGGPTATHPADLLFLVTEDDDRTRRAMRPPHPLTLAAGAIGASFTIWAILQPSHAPMIAGILADGLLAPLMTILESLTRSRGNHRPGRPLNLRPRRCFTRTPEGPNSAAQDLVSERIAVLVAL